MTRVWHVTWASVKLYTTLENKLWISLSRVDDSDISVMPPVQACLASRLGSKRPENWISRCSSKRIHRGHWQREKRPEIISTWPKHNLDHKNTVARPNTELGAIRPCIEHQELQASNSRDWKVYALRRIKEIVPEYSGEAGAAPGPWLSLSLCSISGDCGGCLGQLGDNSQDQESWAGILSGSGPGYVLLY